MGMYYTTGDTCSSSKREAKVCVHAIYHVYHAKCSKTLISTRATRIYYHWSDIRYPVILRMLKLVLKGCFYSLRTFNGFHNFTNSGIKALSLSWLMPSASEFHYCTI